MPVRAPANDEFRKPGQFGGNSATERTRKARAGFVGGSCEKETRLSRVRYPVTLAVGQDEIEAPLPLVEQFQTTGFDARTLNFEQRIELPVLPKVCWSGSEGVRHFSTD